MARIRKMVEEDLPLIEWDGEYARYRKVYREVFRNQLIGLTTALIAESPDDGIVGQVFLTKKEPNPTFSPEDRYLFISSFRVKEPFRGRGLGTLMMKMAELIAQREGLPLLILNCARSNQAALTFYKDAGFEGFRLDDEYGMIFPYATKIPVIGCKPLI